MKLYLSKLMLIDLRQTDNSIMVVSETVMRQGHILNIKYWCFIRVKLLRSSEVISLTSQ